MAFDWFSLDWFGLFWFELVALVGLFVVVAVFGFVEGAEGFGQVGLVEVGGVVGFGGVDLCSGWSGWSGWLGGFEEFGWLLMRLRLCRKLSKVR